MALGTGTVSGWRLEGAATTYSARRPAEPSKENVDVKTPNVFNDDISSGVQFHFVPDRALPLGGGISKSCSATLKSSKPHLRPPMRQLKFASCNPFYRA